MENIVIEAAKRVFCELGRGLTESIYRDALCIELHRLHLEVAIETVLPVYYKGIEVGFVRQDMRVIDLRTKTELVVELKAVTSNITDSHVTQLLSYMRLRNLKCGVLINFNQSDCELKKAILDTEEGGRLCVCSANAEEALNVQSIIITK